MYILKNNKNYPVHFSFVEGTGENAKVLSFHLLPKDTKEVTDEQFSNEMVKQLVSRNHLSFEKVSPVEETEIEEKEE